MCLNYWPSRSRHSRHNHQNEITLALHHTLSHWITTNTSHHHQHKSKIQHMRAEGAIRTRPPVDPPPTDECDIPRIRGRGTALLTAATYYLHDWCAEITNSAILSWWQYTSTHDIGWFSLLVRAYWPPPPPPPLASFVEGEGIPTAVRRRARPKLCPAVRGGGSQFSDHRCPTFWAEFLWYL